MAKEFEITPQAMFLALHRMPRRCAVKMVSLILVYSHTHIVSIKRHRRRHRRAAYTGIG